MKSKFLAYILVILLGAIGAGYFYIGDRYTKLGWVFLGLFGLSFVNEFVFGNILSVLVLISLVHTWFAVDVVNEKFSKGEL